MVIETTPEVWKTSILTIIRLRHMVGTEGIEPSFAVPQTAVLAFILRTPCGAIYETRTRDLTLARSCFTSKLILHM